MSQSTIVEILLAVLAVMIGVGAYLGAARANRATEVTARGSIDQHAYEQAQRIYESAINTLEGQISGLQTRVASLESQIVGLGVANDSLILQLHQLRKSNNDLSIEIDRLRKSNDKKDGIHE
jgi:hypothetical protein